MSYHPDADHAQQFSQTPKKTDYDVVIIGGATSGSTISFFLSANPDFKGSVLVVERDPSLSESATRASNYCMRQQFATEINIKIAQYAAHFVKNFRQIVQDESGLAPDLYIRDFGYLYLADNEEFAQTLRDDQKTQAALGAGTRIVSKEEIAKLYPFFDVSNVLLGSLNTQDEGEFDGWTIFQNLRRVATARGVDYIQNEVVDITVTNNNVDSITLKTGERIKVGKVVNAAGTRSGKVSAMAGIHLPLEARQRYTYIFEGEHKLDRDVPLTIDPSGVHVRQFGDKFLAGAPPEGPEVGVAVDDFNVRGDVWATKMGPVMERLLPALGKLTVTETWVGHYDFNTFDHNAIIGPHHVIKNFLFCCGFSGHGSQQGPACGRAISELITYNKFKTLDLTCLRYERIEKGERMLERMVI